MILEVLFPIPLYKTFDYIIPSDFPVQEIAELVGKRVRVPFGRTHRVGFAWKLKESSEFPLSRLRPIARVIDDDPILDEKGRQLADWLSLNTACSLGDAVFALIPEKENTKETAIPRSHPVTPTRLSSSWKELDEAFHQALFQKQNRSIFLEGGTLADRVQAYLPLISDVLSQEKNVLFVLPEIQAASDVFQMLKQKFGETVGFWDSEQWWKVNRHAFSIVVGARSVALCPLHDLGLIVLEEETSSSYKEERRPRFHARDVVLQRASEHKALLIMGDVLPSLMTYSKIQRGDVQNLRIAVNTSRHVEIRFVDMRHEGKKGRLSPVLKEAMSEKLQLNQKIILLLNRKGAYKFLRCPKCHWVVPYDQKEKMPTHCQDCGEKKLRSTGFGIETLVTDVQKEFPWVNVVKWDGDLAKKGKIPSDFDVLVGTEAVSHGFHFPNVGLVGIIDADIALRIPDYHSSERTFDQLIRLVSHLEHQSVAADLIIQTRNPDHDVFQAIAKNDHEKFFKAELRFREELGYPPFSHVLVVRSEEKSEKKAEIGLENFSNWVRLIDPDGKIGILGPVLQSIPKKHTRLFQCLLKIPADLLSSFTSQLRLFLSEKSRHLWFDRTPS